MVTLAPLTSHKMQPLDRTFFRSLKFYYNRAADSWMGLNPGRRISIYQMAGLFGQAYYKAANVEKGVEGFRTWGIWPFNRDIFTDQDFAAAQLPEHKRASP